PLRGSSRASSAISPSCSPRAGPPGAIFAAISTPPSAWPSTAIDFPPAESRPIPSLNPTTSNRFSNTAPHLPIDPACHNCPMSSPPIYQFSTSRYSPRQASFVLLRVLCVFVLSSLTSRHMSLQDRYKKTLDAIAAAAAKARRDARE